jgi:hypothetical protein
MGQVSMRVFPVLLSTGAVALVASQAPWSKLQKVLFAFGYFPFYEYSALSRPYSLALLLSVVATVLLVSPRRRPVVLGLVLGLMAQTSSYGAVLAVAFGAAAFYDAWDRRRTVAPQAWWRWGMGATLLAAGFALALYPTLAILQTRPGDPSFQFTRSAAIDHRILLGLGTLWKAWCPLPFPTDYQWNTNLLDPWPWIEGLCGVVGLVLLMVLVARSQMALLLLALGALGVVALGTGYYYAMRHSGHAFLALMGVIWLADSLPAADKTGKYGRWLMRASSWRPTVITVLLIMHMVAALLSSVKEQAVPFSGSREAAEIIRERGLENLPILVDRDYAGSSVAGCLDRPVFYAAREKWGTYCLWDNPNRMKEMTPQSLMPIIQRVMEEMHSDVVVVLNYPIDTLSGMRVLQVGVTKQSIAQDEKYLILLIMSQAPTKWPDRPG